MNTKSRFQPDQFQKLAQPRVKRFAVSAILIGLCVARLAGCATTDTAAFGIVAEHQVVDKQSGT